MFVLIYRIFVAALLFVGLRIAAIVWLSLAVANMPIQFLALKRDGARNGFVGVMLASLCLWPIQFAAAGNSSRTAKEAQEDSAVNREKLGPLPAPIEGTVSFAHHHGTEEGHDSVWLEEYGDLDFLTDAETFDRIGIAEGQRVFLEIEERAAPADLAAGQVVWIVDGKTLQCDP